MSKRLQVVLEDGEFAEVQQAADEEGLSVSRLAQSGATLVIQLDKARARST